MSGWADRQGGEEDVDEEEALEDEFRSVEDHVLFLIDARPAMFEKSDKGEAFIVNCLRVAQNVMKTKIVASDRSCVGVVLFGAAAKRKEETPAGSAIHPQVLPLFPLDVPSADRLKKLANLLRDDGGAGLEDEIDRSVQQQPLVPLREALWVCATAFHAVGTKQRAGTGRGDSKRLWLFTNDDRPNMHEAGEQARIVQVARDCAETGIELSLWHLPPSRSDEFNPDLFYVEVLLGEKEYKNWKAIRGDGSNTNASLSQSYADSFTEEDSEEMLSLRDRIQASGYDGFDAKEYRMRRKEHKKRRLGTVTLNLSGKGEAGSAIAMGMYKLVHPAARPQYTWLQSINNKPTKSVSILMDNTTGAVLNETQITTYMEFNGMRIPMSADEVKAIKSSQPVASGSEADADKRTVATPFINLLYCIPQSALKPDMQLKDSSFLFPDDSTIVGSMSLFRCLLRQLVDKGLIAIGHMLRTAGGEARLVALYPCDEKKDAEGYMELPGGLYVIPLPFVQDIRNVTEEHNAAVEIAESAVTSALDLVGGMQFGSSFRYTDLESPGIQYFYSMLQAIALNDEHCEWRAEGDDMLQPDAESLRVHESRILAFSVATGLGDDTGESESKPKVSRKRAAPAGLDDDIGDSDSKPKVSRKRAVPAADAGAIPDISELDGCSLAQLKEVCKARGLPVSGTKAVLIKRIRDHA